MLRGTVKQHVALMGYAEQFTEEYQPLIAAGYGLVVGLEGTGSRDVPPQVRAHMIADLARRGIGEATRGWGHMEPEEMLDSLDTAVVIVEAIIPQAASGRKSAPTGVRSDHPALRGTTFDVRVHAEPSSGTESLEGGHLLTTLLRPGLLSTGRAQARVIGAASGPVFLNPFAEPGAVGRDSVLRTSGRILNGGEVMHDMPLRLVLFAPSHTRAAAIQTAINRRFPQEPGQGAPTAHAMNDTMIEIHVPPSLDEHIDNFVDLMTHVSLRQQNPESIALSIKRLLLADPSPKNADAAAWRWQSLGARSLPVTRQLYDHAEDLPRVAALRAGAGLGDPIAVPHLVKIATVPGPLTARLEAIDLLKGMPADIRIEQGLRELLDEEDPELRLRTVETLVHRGDPQLIRWNVDDKFELIIAKSRFPMIYVTQTGLPRIIVLGTNLEIVRPLTLQAWSNSLLVRESEVDESLLEVRYAPDDGRPPVLLETSPQVASFVDFLAHRETPEEPRQGLDLSYGRTVGALHALWRQSYLDVDFKAEQDRLLAAIQRLSIESGVLERPEFEVGGESAEPSPYLDPLTAQ